jgi:hypothetical protein
MVTHKADSFIQRRLRVDCQRPQWLQTGDRFFHEAALNGTAGLWHIILAKTRLAVLATVRAGQILTATTGTFHGPGSISRFM